MDDPALNSSDSILHSRQYLLYWFSSLLSNIGTWMQQVAQPWLILSLSHSSFLVGLDGFILNAPGWIFTLWGGVIADRLDRKQVVIFCQTIQLFCILLILALLATGTLRVWEIIVISFFIGTTDSLSMPSFQSIIPSLVKRADISRAIALNATQFNLSRMLGPAIAGIVIVKYGAIACFGANAVSYIPFFISLVWIYPRSNRVKSGGEPLRLSAYNTEFRNLLNSAEIRFPLATIFVTSLFCSPIITFCPVLIRDVFHAEVTAFGGAMAAFGLGAVIGGSLGFVPLPRKMKRSQISSYVAIALTILLVAIALNRFLPLLVCLMVAAGLALTTSNIFANTFLQEIANNENRGKLVSLCQFSLQAGVSGGALLTGFTASLFGVSLALFFNAIAGLILQSYILLKASRSRAMLS